MNVPAGREFLNKAIKSTRILLLSKKACPHCQNVESMFKSYKAQPTVIHVDDRFDVAQIEAAVKKLTGDSNLPKLFLGGIYFGNKTDIEDLHRDGVLGDIVQKASLPSMAKRPM